MSRLHRRLMEVPPGDIAVGRIAAGASLPREADLAVRFRAVDEVRVTSAGRHGADPRTGGRFPTAGLHPRLETKTA